MNLEKMNLALLEVEERLRNPRHYDNVPPFYFVIGAPRSGTTLLTQLLAHCFDFGYITNLAARFWLTPVLGIQFSKEVLGERMTPSLKSHYATTEHAGDIHEFGRFWMSHLGLSSSQDVDWMVPDEEYASLTLRALRAIQSQFKVPIVMKGIYPAYASEWMNENFEIRWINIEREAVDTCISILDARRKKLRDEHGWFGWHIPRSDRQVDKKKDSFYLQIANQVTYFQRVYSEIADVTVHLEYLCANAGFELCHAANKRLVKQVPPELEYKHKNRYSQDGEKFREALRTL